MGKAMNREKASRIVIQLFEKGNPSLALVASEAFLEIGDKDKATKFSSGQMSVEDKYDAVEMIYKTVIDSLKKAKDNPEEFVRIIETVKHEESLIDFLLDATFFNADEQSQWIGLVVDSKYREQTIGKVARALILLGFEEPQYTLSHIRDKYKLCYDLGFYCDAAAWKELELRMK